MPRTVFRAALLAEARADRGRVQSADGGEAGKAPP